jgi:hypothetical protein
MKLLSPFTVPAQRTAALYLTLATLTFAASSLSYGQAQSGSDPGVDGTNIQQSAGKPMRMFDGQNGKNSKTVMGQCIIIKSANNPFQQACVDIVLTLIDAQGNELAEARTNSKGHFEFGVADATANYTVQAKSKSYVVASPTKPAKPGSGLLLKLQQQ